MTKRKTSRPVLEASLQTAEVIFDAIGASGVLASIPFVGTAFHAVKAVDSVRDGMLAHKIARFVEGAQISADDVSAMVERLKGTEELQRVGNVTLNVIDKFTEDAQTLLLGELFRCLVEGSLGPSQYRRLARAIDVAFLDDLMDFIEAGDDIQLLALNSKAALVEAGLTRLHSRDSAWNGHIGVSGYLPTEYGVLLRLALKHYQLPAERAFESAASRQR